MNKKFLAGSALATLLVIPAAGYLTLELARNQPIVDQEKIAGTVSKNDMPKPAQPRLSEAPAEENRPAQSSAADSTQVLRDKEPQAAKSAAELRAEFDAGEIATLKNKSEDSAAALGMAKRAAPAAPGVVAQGQLSAEPMAAAPSPVPPAEGNVQVQLDPSRERFANAAANPIKSVATDPVSTFSADVSGRIASGNRA